MIYPNNIEDGKKIGVTATSEGFSTEVDYRRLDQGMKHFHERGYPGITTDNVRK